VLVAAPVVEAEAVLVAVEVGPGNVWLSLLLKHGSFHQYFWAGNQEDSVNQ